MAYGISLILSSGSRGAIVGSGVAILFYLFRATARQRGVALVVVPVLVVALLGTVPQRSLNRITSLVSSSGNVEDTEASSVSRMYLLKTGIQAAIDHPMFGVGQGMFAIYEGQHGTVVGGYRGEYQETHNSYVTAAAECGIPAFIFYMGGLFSTFRLLNAVHRQARGRSDCHDIRVTTFCILLGMVGFCTAMFFVNFTYFYYLPALAGLAIAVSHAAQAEFRSRSVVSTGPQTVHPSAGWTRLRTPVPR
jgi:O-antigen ligase